MKVLVLASDYPSENSKAMYWTHVRNKVYLLNDIETTVISFAAKKSYVFEQVKVYSLLEFYQIFNINEFDKIICHAPNLRSHYIFLKKNNKLINKIIFIFHGHEIRICSRAYPRPYNYNNNAKKKISRFLKTIYDLCKVKIWGHFFRKIDSKGEFVFVSRALYHEFTNNIKLPNSLQDHVHIINNPIGESFLYKTFSNEYVKNYDFITIRSNIDSSVYCIDIVNRIAIANKKYKFLIIGKGDFFDYNDKADNIEVISAVLDHNDLLKYIDQSKYALMPTRCDSQGVMSCELASYGIPLITSDLEVTREIFKDFKNVLFIANEKIIENFDDAITSVSSLNGINKQAFSIENTVYKEIKLIKTV